MHAPVEPFSPLRRFPSASHGALEATLRLLSPPFLAALLALGATAAQYLPLDDIRRRTEEGLGFITREWTWSTGTWTTTFTAYGPAEQVNQLDPQDRTPDCPDCELASSTHFEPDDEAEPTWVAE